MRPFTIGADVELFAKKGNKFVSAIPFIGDFENGTKYNPLRFPAGHTLQRDNVAAEFATRVATSYADFVDSIHCALKEAVDYMPSNISLSAVSSVVFAEDELQHPEAFEFGCDPDFNAWCKGNVNPKPCAMNHKLRTAGGHIHVGSPLLKSKRNKIKMIQLMDSILGIESVLLDNSKESVRRKELYGKAGAFRPTPYGVEYRPLSNFWIKSPEYVKWAYLAVEQCLGILKYGGHQFWVDTKCGGVDEINTIINTGNVALASRMSNAKPLKTKSLREEWGL